MSSKRSLYLGRSIDGLMQLVGTREALKDKSIAKYVTICCRHDFAQAHCLLVICCHITEFVKWR